ncbi:MAG: hypothetical protein L0229_09410 [Blastocatellia bacterium]|nr:hypothetical protein [Blastocatellia bacterium]
MNLVVDKLVEVLSSPPGIGLSTDRLGSRRPAGTGDIPAISISLTLEKRKGAAIARFIRSGDSLAKSTNIIEVRPSPTTFSDDLKSLRIWPLPLKRNPSSTSKVFTGTDVQIRNVTVPASPIEYTITAKPAQKDEFRLDPTRAQIYFGAVQTEGEKLELVHWTVTWRDEILGDRYSGSMAIEIWAGSFTQADDLSRKLQDILKSSRARLREKGFFMLNPLSLGTIENTLRTPPLGSPFPVWKQEIGYVFAFEAEEGGELSGGIPIERINVDMDDQIAESFSVP